MVIDQRAAERSAARARLEPTRRGLLAGAAAFGVLSSAKAAPPRRVAAIDWAMLETTLALGVAPVAASELILFRKAAIEPELPPGVADLGLRGSISYERLYEARPDLILISPWYESRAHILARVAPVASYAIYGTGATPYDRALAVTRELGARLGREAEAAALVDAHAAAIDAARLRLARLAGRRVLIMNLADARHFRAFGPDSMFGDIAARLGLSVAWSAPTRFGAYPTVGVEALADLGDAMVVNVGPTPPAALAGVRDSPLWSAMPPIAAGRFLDVAAVNPYGALPAAGRFARLLSGALAALADG